MSKITPEEALLREISNKPKGLSREQLRYALITARNSLDWDSYTKEFRKALDDEILRLEEGIKND